jgi:hypothetical protein
MGECFCKDSITKRREPYKGSIEANEITQGYTPSNNYPEAPDFKTQSKWKNFSRFF